MRAVEDAMRRLGATLLASGPASGGGRRSGPPKSPPADHDDESERKDRESSARIAAKIEALAEKARAEIREWSSRRPGAVSGGSAASGAQETGAGLAILAGMLVVFACSAANVGP